MPPTARVPMPALLAILDLLSLLSPTSSVVDHGLSFSRLAEKKIG